MQSDDFMVKFIQHRGIVKNIENNTVFVRIEQQSACSACHARSACLASDKAEKIIEVTGDGNLFEPGEEVVVSVRSSMGIRAVVLAFVLPFILVVTVVFAGIGLTGDESIGGLAGLAVLFPYYILIYLFRNKINKRFLFTVSKAASVGDPVINYI